MAEGLLLEFEGVGIETYHAVSERLGIEPNSSANWPDGLLFHAGGAKPGGFVVFEVWATRDAQQAFMDERLGAALQAGGVTGPPARAEWLELASYASAGG
jgi:hypothetical protein